MTYDQFLQWRTSRLKSDFFHLELVTATRLSELREEEKDFLSFPKWTTNSFIQKLISVNHVRFQRQYSLRHLPMVSIYSIPQYGQGIAGVNFFLVMFNRFSVSLTSCLTKAREPGLPNYFSLAGRRIIRFIRFLRVLALCEIQSALTRIWSCVAMFISYDDNHLTTTPPYSSSSSCSSK